MNLSKHGVGVTLELSTDCMGNKKGTRGVCVDVYELADRKGMMFLFPNGRYDGFSMLEVNRFFDMSSIDICTDEDVIYYQFENVIKLSRDFEAGLFEQAF